MRQTVAVCLVLTLVVLIGGCHGTGTVLAPRKIAFTTDRDSNWEVYVMEADGSNPTNLTNNSAGDHVPAWSPDGSQIAFYSDRDSNYEVFVMEADGSNPTNRTNNSAADVDPGW